MTEFIFGLGIGLATTALLYVKMYVPLFTKNEELEEFIVKAFSNPWMEKRLYRWMESEDYSNSVVSRLVSKG